MVASIIFSFLPLIIYLSVLGFIIWFATNLINAQRERNVLLKEISSKLSNIEVGKKED